MIYLHTIESDSIITAEKCKDQSLGKQLGGYTEIRFLLWEQATG